MKSHSTEGIRRWFKIGDYKRRKIGVAAVGKKAGYKSPGRKISDRWTKISKKEGGGYLSDNCGL